MVRKNSSSSSSSSCPKEGLKRGAWTSQEDELLSDYIGAHGLGRWRTLPANAGLNRCGKSCRLRWLNYLRPHIKRGNITEEEEELIIRLHKLLGNRWSLIAGRLPGRTDNEIKNYWNTHIRRKLLLGGSAKMNTTCSMITTEASAGGTPHAAAEEEGEEEAPVLVNVIRTKAVRCTRSTLFADPLPAEYQYFPQLQAPPEQLSGCNNNNNNNNNNNAEEPWMVQIHPQLDSPYDTSCSDSLHHHHHHNNNVEQYYVGDDRSWFGSGGGDQGLYSTLLLDTDACVDWDSLINIHTTTTTTGECE